MYYLNYFFIFSIFGHLFETLLFKLMNKNLKSGFLYGYWTPVYGLGVVLIIIIANLLFKKLDLNKVLEVIIFFIVITLILTFIEYAGGNLLEFIFKKEFWNYSDHKYHFGKYIALDISLIWGLCSITFLYLIKPWMDKIVNKIPPFVTYVFLILFIIDISCTLLFKSKR
jgi:uncharacterized membrane protein